MEEKIEIKEESTKNRNGLLIAILIIIIIVMGCVIGYLLWNEKQNDKTRKEEKGSEVEKVKEVYLTDEVIKKLLNYVPVAKPYGGIPEYDGVTGKSVDINMYYSAYSNKKLEVKDMDANWMVINSMGENHGNDVNCSYYNYIGGFYCESYNLETIKTTLNSHYGKDMVKLPEKVHADFLFNCEINNKEYVCRVGGGGYSTGGVNEYFGLFSDAASSVLITQFSKAEKSDNNLYLYVTFARAVFKTTDEYHKSNNTTFQLYKYGSGNELISDTVFKGEDYYKENETKPFDAKIIEQFKDKMTTYKITYKVGELDSYTLLSVEPVE